jgi:hypothetical protein
MIKIVFIILLLAFILIAACESNCMIGEDYKITVSVFNNRDIPENLGLSNTHNVTLNITNFGNSLAESVTIYTYYCNDFKFGQRECENRTINVGDIPPKSTVNEYFEYTRILAQDQLDGTYSLQYNATSCLPITVVNNIVIVNQRQ